MSRLLIVEDQPDIRRLVREYILENAGDRELPAWLKPGGKVAD